MYVNKYFEHRKSGRPFAVMLSLLAVAVASVGSAAQTSTQPSSASDTKEKRQEQRFLMRAQAAAARTLEISRVASTRASDPQVKSFAQQIVTERQSMIGDLRPMLTSAGLDSTIGSIGSATAPDSNIGSSASTGAVPDKSRSSASSSSAQSTPGSLDSPGGSSLNRNDSLASTPGSGFSPSSGSSSSSNSGSGVSDLGMTGRTEPGNPYGASSTVGSGASGTSSQAVATTSKAPSPTLRDRWNRMIGDRKVKNVSEKSGADFDKAYLNLMQDEHEDSVDLFEDAAEDGPAQVQTFANQYLPKLRQDLDRAQSLEKSIH